MFLILINILSLSDYCDKPDNMGHEQILQKHLENNEIKFELKNFKNYLFRDKDKRTRILQRRFGNSIEFR